MVLLLLLALAQLMVILDISAVNVALPDLAKDLDIGGGDLGWTITSYSLVFGSLLLLGGRAADLLGRRRVFLTGLGVFTVASLASALATSEGGLLRRPRRPGPGRGDAVPGRAVDHHDHLPGSRPREGARRLGCRRRRRRRHRRPAGRRRSPSSSTGAPSSSSTCPSASASPSRRRRSCPPTSPDPQWRGLDLRGAVVATASLAALVYALSQAADAGWTSAQTLGLGLAGLAGLAAFAALELHTRTPLLNISRLGERGVGGGFVMMLAASAVLFGSFLLTSIYLQEVLGTGALETGLAFLPMAVIIGLGAHLGSHLVGHAGPADRHGRRVRADRRRHAAAGRRRRRRQLPRRCPARACSSPAWASASRWSSVALSVLTGAADDEAGMLSGLNTTGHEIGGSLGVAVLVTIATGAIGTGRRPRPPASPTASATRSWSPASSPPSPASSPCSCCPRRRASCRSCALAPRVAIH